MKPMEVGFKSGRRTPIPGSLSSIYRPLAGESIGFPPSDYLFDWIVSAAQRAHLSSTTKGLKTVTTAAANGDQPDSRRCAARLRCPLELVSTRIMDGLT